MAVVEKRGVRRYVLIAVAVALVLAGAVAYLVATATPAACAPEARQAALAQDARDVIAGRIRLDVAYQNEYERALACAD